MSTGVTFHNNLGNDGLGTQQFRWTGVNVPGLAGCTYIWRCKFSQQNGYYTTFFYDTNITNDYLGDRSYIGCHPYPLVGYENNNAANGVDHWFELSCDGGDVCGIVRVKDSASPWTNCDIDDGGNNTSAITDNTRWYTQALVVSAVNGVPTAYYYWDLDTSLTRRISWTFLGKYDCPASGTSGLTVGASPWPGTTITETMDGTIRGIQLYSQPFPINIVSAEAANITSNTPTTTSGTTYVWYMNQNPTPSDISDKSGLGHNPTWVASSSGTLFSAADNTNVTISTGVLSGAYSISVPQVNFGSTFSVGVLSGTYSIGTMTIKASRLEINSASIRLKF